ncbi:hypothetical protein LZ318_11955 [Saccharopolyspora indica]|uniref:hypothetical protein n=1 Tax=Saccharopolyspora indica TaxID=1229659 RepID=UPI0022EAF6B4|nr:hypothetical protein [Saccharopolyspora indica]MDA3643778.1 hypothetical protein [Saccharopolyspora indica]
MDDEFKVNLDLDTTKAATEWRQFKSRVERDRLSTTLRINTVGGDQGAAASSVQRMTRLVQSETEKLAAALRGAEDRIRQSRDQHLDLMGRVRVAELQLTETRNSAFRSASRVAAAEENLASLRRKLVNSTRQVAQANESYRMSLWRWAAETTKVEKNNKRLLDSLDSLERRRKGGRDRGMLGMSFRMMGNLAVIAADGIQLVVRSMSGLIQGSLSAGQALGGVAQGLAQSAASGVLLAVQAALLVALFGLVAVALQVVVGLIVTLVGVVGVALGGLVAGFAGLPVVAAAAAAAFAAVKLGMEGIQRAAKTLQPEVDRLKSALEDTFERGLTPVFDRLRVIFPIIQDALVGVADEAVRAAGGIAEMLTSQVGMENLRGAANGIKLAFQQMGPGLQAIMWQLLDIAGTEIYYRILGDTISQVAQRFAEFLARLQENGRLANALDRVRIVLNAVVDLFSQMAIAATDFLIGAGPGLANFFDSITEFLGKIDWQYAGETFGGMFDTIAEAIRNIPQQTIDRFMMSLHSIILAVEDFAASGGFDLLIEAFTMLGFALSGFMMIADEVLSFFKGLVIAVNPAMMGVFDALDQVTARSRQMREQTRGNFLGLQGEIGAATSGISGDVRGMATDIVNSASRGGAGARDKMREGMAGMSDAVRQGKDRARNEAAQIPGAVTNGIGPVGGMLQGSGQSLIQGFVSGIRSMIGKVKAAASAVVNAARNFFPFSPAKEGPFSGRGYTLYSGRALVEDFAKGIDQRAHLAERAVEGMMGAADQTATAEWSGHISSDGFGMTGSVYEGVLAAFHGSRLQVDGAGMAKLVNKTNTRNNRR